MVEILEEDDGNWFLAEDGFSSHWLEQFIYLVVVAQNWMKKYAIPDKFKGRVYGYKLRKPS
jgi:hypothetical protein